MQEHKKTCKGLDKKGRELVDSTPNRVKLGLGNPRQESLGEMVKRMISDGTKGYAEANDLDTFDDADDFDLEEDPEISSPWEVYHDPIHGDEVYAKDIVARRLAKAKEEHKKASKAYKKSQEELKRNSLKSTEGSSPSEVKKTEKL